MPVELPTVQTAYPRMSSWPCSHMLGFVLNQPVGPHCLTRSNKPGQGESASPVLPPDPQVSWAEHALVSEPLDRASSSGSSCVPASLARANHQSSV